MIVCGIGLIGAKSIPERRDRVYREKSVHLFMFVDFYRWLNSKQAYVSQQLGANLQVQHKDRWELEHSRGNDVRGWVEAIWKRHEIENLTNVWRKRLSFESTEKFQRTWLFGQMIKFISTKFSDFCLFPHGSSEKIDEIRKSKPNRDEENQFIVNKHESN